MNVCKDRPETLPPLDAIGIENSDPMSQQFAAGGRTPGGAGGRAGTRLGGKVGLGITGGAGAPFGGKPGFSMGNFQTPARTGADGDRFRSVSTFAGPGGVPMGRPVAMQRTASGSGLANQVPSSPGGGRQRSLRGRQRPESRQPSQAMMPPPNQPGFEPVEPLTKSENRWKPAVAVPRSQRVEAVDTPEMVERKVKALLNKLTLEKFDSISDQIVAFANRSEQETDGHTLIHVIKLVFEKATDEPAWSEMYARLCRKMMERISPKVFDVQVKNSEGALIVGGQLFRKYLLNRCQEDFERGYIQRRQLAEESAAAGQPQQKEGEEVMFSEAYYATQKAKRRGFGLVKLIGELFKLQMLTERIMHECIRKMLANVEHPEEEEVESLCKLLATVGQQLDTEKAKAHMTIYFQRMKEMVKILRERAERGEVSSRMMFMLQDIIDLREKFNWEPRKKSAGQGPMTIAEVHQAALREEAQKEADKQRQAMSRGGSRRGDPRDYGHDGWQNVQGGPPARPAPPAKAGDLSKFGNISKPSGPIGGFGPSNVFKKADAKNARPEAPAPPTRTNMFNVLGGADAPVEAEAAAPKAPSRKPSVDLAAGASAADAGSGRKKLKLLPRSIPLKDEDSAPPSAVDSVDEAPSMSEEKAKAKIDEDLQEFWQVGDVEEAANYFKDLPSNYHEQLIDKFVSDALNKKDADIANVADVFSRCASAGTVSPESFKKGLSGSIEFLDDIAVDVPQAYAFMAKLLKGTQLSQSDLEELAGKISVEGSPLVAPKDKLLKEVAKLA
ncbi:ARM repeat-containing protein [Calocera cornea HHB12733]|uniref:ARM repeat-containing protein n=1 Tax=Calocera cornea HHB12733 TaxID=1353952 RepID=A0A165H0D7_9BASI|nr:ARM repeat-containing protein [Calocera cornea HHB12733]